MDELIRELEEMASLSRQSVRSFPESASVFKATAEAFEEAAALARQAKRRMADREPAWDVIA